MQCNYQNVTLTGGFWKQKEDLNRDVTIDAVYNRFDETGRVAAFRCDWKDGMPYRPHIFWDSDVAKWMEGAAYQLSRDDDPALRAKVEALIDEIEKNQHADGYFNIYYTVVDPDHRFTNRDNHELYCAGHLIEAAVAYHDAVGDTRFLGLMEKYAQYIKAVFMDAAGTGTVGSLWTRATRATCRCGSSDPWSVTRCARATFSQRWQIWRGKRTTRRWTRRAVHYLRTWRTGRCT